MAEVKFQIDWETASFTELSRASDLSMADPHRAMQTVQNAMNDAVWERLIAGAPTEAPHPVRRAMAFGGVRP